MATWHARTSAPGIVNHRYVGTVQGIASLTPYLPVTTHPHIILIRSSLPPPTSIAHHPSRARHVTGDHEALPLQQEATNTSEDETTIGERHAISTRRGPQAAHASTPTAARLQLPRATPSSPTTASFHSIILQIRLTHCQCALQVLRVDLNPRQGG